MKETGETTLVLGPEYDGALRVALRDVLIRLGAKGVSRDWTVGGSQELETLSISVGSDEVVIEAETFVGLCVRGPVQLVERIRDMVKAATASES